MPSPSYLTSPGSAVQSVPTSLTLAIVLDSCEAPHWVHYVIEKLRDCKSIEMSIVILSRRSKAAKVRHRGPILFRCWHALDLRIRRPNTDALELRDLSPLLKSNGSMRALSFQTDSSQPLLVDGVAFLDEANVDLLLYLGRGVPTAEIAARGRLGVWFLKGSTLSESEIPDLFWDMYEGNHLMQYGPRVIEHRRNRAGLVYRAYGITNSLSLALNQNAAAWDIAQFLVTQLSDSERLRTSMQALSEADVSPRSLSNTRMARFLVRWLKRTLGHEFKKRFFREQWSIAVQSRADVPKMDSAQNFEMLRPPRDRFYADPFLIERNGRNYLFFEDYRFAAKKGVISCCGMDGEGNCGEPRVVLERKYHLSYPFLFTWQGEVYMVPESLDNGTIEIYRASNFPYSWIYEGVLMPNVAAADPTLLHHRDRWWLFTAGVRDHASPNENLFLFFAESPFGPWTAHPKNPIVSDARHARPAGCLYFDNGQLIRPGQDCSRGYGYATQLHRVEVLSETDYRETLLTSITPSWISGSRGIHTFNQNADFRVLDCKFVTSRFTLSKLSPHFTRLCAELGNSFLRKSAKNLR